MRVPHKTKSPSGLDGLDVLGLACVLARQADFMTLGSMQVLPPILERQTPHTPPNQELQFTVTTCKARPLIGLGSKDQLLASARSCSDPLSAGVKVVWQVTLVFAAITARGALAQVVLTLVAELGTPEMRQTACTASPRLLKPCAPWFWQVAVAV